MREIRITSTTLATDTLLARVDRALARAVDRLIEAYQRRLSPLKGRGRACAHRVLHGGACCSQHVRELLSARGLRGAMPGIRSRFEACRAAALQFEGSASPPGGVARGRRRYRGQCCIVVPLPACQTTRTIPR